MKVKLISDSNYGFDSIGVYLDDGKEVGRVDIIDSAEHERGLVEEMLAAVAGEAVAKAVANERRIWQDAVSWQTPIPCSPEDIGICTGCLAFLDTSTCECGDAIDGHGEWSGHSAQPMGCQCRFQTSEAREKVGAIRARAEKGPIDG
jgi:hypothetical protein